LRLSKLTSIRLLRRPHSTMHFGFVTRNLSRSRSKTTASVFFCLQTMKTPQTQISTEKQPSSAPKTWKNF